MRTERRNSIKVLLIGIILVCLIAGYYYYLSHKDKDRKEEQVETTVVQEILMYNFERNYPPTPKEVVKFFGEFTKCFYNETYTEDEFLQLAAHIQNLYDDELIANQTENQYIENLRWDVEQMKEQEIVLSSYSTSASTDVEEYSYDGYNWAKLYCYFNLRKGTCMGTEEYVFLLRRDDEKHWKIYGWALAEDEPR